MAPNLFGNSATLFLEASQQVPMEKLVDKVDACSKPKQTVTKKYKWQIVWGNVIAIIYRQFGKSTALPLEASKQAPKIKPVDKLDTYTRSMQADTSKYKWQIVWRNVIAFVYLHIGAVYGLYLFFTKAKFLTFLWTIGLAASCAVGITAGAHRLWCHRSYKAKWPLRMILMIAQTVAFQNHLFEWVRDHRVHHKFTDTDADPHNAKRGFFFSHMGWLLVRKHPDVARKGASVDMSDLEADPIVVWQRRLYLILMPIFAFYLPSWIPCYFWGEEGMNAWYATLFRYTASLHATWLVNSAAHVYGTRPYDDTISATDNIRVALGAFGEGWHNYHHVFPWDYKAAELGNYRANFTTAFIDFWAWIGWAYDLKTVPLEMIETRAARTGDGSRCQQNWEDENHHEDAIWGWGDKDMHQEDVVLARIHNKIE